PTTWCSSTTWTSSSRRVPPSCAASAAAASGCRGARSPASSGVPGIAASCSSAAPSPASRISSRRTRRPRRRSASSSRRPASRADRLDSPSHAGYPRGMRTLHTMLRVNDLEESLRFYCDVLGMRLLRRKDYPAGRFTLAFVGYGSEDEQAVLELTHNWDTDH